MPQSAKVRVPIESASAGPAKPRNATALKTANAKSFLINYVPPGTNYTGTLHCPVIVQANCQRSLMLVQFAPFYSIENKHLICYFSPGTAHSYGPVRRILP